MPHVLRCAFVCPSAPANSVVCASALPADAINQGTRAVAGQLVSFPPSDDALRAHVCCRRRQLRVRPLLLLFRHLTRMTSRGT